MVLDCLLLKIAGGWFSDLNTPPKVDNVSIMVTSIPTMRSIQLENKIQRYVLKLLN